jgi:replicative DNA helicase
VTNQSKRRFCEKIRVIGKDQNFEKLKKHLPSKDDRLFPTESIPERMRVEWDGCHGKRWRSATCTKSRRTARADTLRLFSSAANVKKVLNGDLAWDQIKSIHFRGQEMTYDLAVPVHHSFVVNDILTHNTTFGNNWCYNAVTRFKKNVVYVSFEMTREQLRRSIITIHTANARFAQQGFKALDYRFIRDGLLTKEEKDFYLNHVIADFESNPTYTHYEVITPDRDWTMDDVRIQLEQLHKEFEVGLVVLDHGQWIEARRSRKNKDYTIELNSVVNDSKRLALTFDHNNGIPVVMLFQINRQGKDIADKNEGVYKISALTYSNACEKSADVITATYLNKELRAAGLTKFSCLKNRDNPPFEPFEAHINFMCRKIMSAKRLEPQGFSVTSHDDYLGAIDIAL